MGVPLGIRWTPRPFQSVLCRWSDDVIVSPLDAVLNLLCYALPRYAIYALNGNETALHDAGGSAYVLCGLHGMGRPGVFGTGHWQR